MLAVYMGPCAMPERFRRSRRSAALPHGRGGVPSPPAPRDRLTGKAAILAAETGKAAILAAETGTTRLGVITGTTRILRVAAARGLPPSRHRLPTGTSLAGGRDGARPSRMVGAAFHRRPPGARTNGSQKLRTWQSASKNVSALQKASPTGSFFNPPSHPRRKSRFPV